MKLVTLDALGKESYFISCILLCLLDSMLYALYYHEKQRENENKPTNQNAKMLFSGAY